MDAVTRRGILTVIPGAGLAAALSLAPRAGAADPSSPPQGELLVIGPFGLGDWFAAAAAEHPLGAHSTLGVAPADAELVKSLNECKLFVIDRRSLKDPERPSFPLTDADYPVIAVAGKSAHSWGEKGTSFSIELEESRVHNNSIRNRATPPFKMVSAGLTLKVRAVAWVGKAETTHCIGRSVAYDVYGRQRRG
jgi:hypothetical protein